MVSLFGEDVGDRVEDLITPGGDQQLLDGVTYMYIVCVTPLFLANCVGMYIICFACE